MFNTFPSHLSISSWTMKHPLIQIILTFCLPWTNLAFHIPYSGVLANHKRLFRGHKRSDFDHISNAQSEKSFQNIGPSFGNPKIDFSSQFHSPVSFNQHGGGFIRSLGFGGNDDVQPSELDVIYPEYNKPDHSEWKELGTETFPAFDFTVQRAPSNLEPELSSDDTMEWFPIKTIQSREFPMEQGFGDLISTSNLEEFPVANHDFADQGSFGTFLDTPVTYPEVNGFGDSGFEDDTTGCENINDKACVRNSDCSCHGFYYCNNQKQRCVPHGLKSGHGLSESWPGVPIQEKRGHHSKGKKRSTSEHPN